MKVWLFGALEVDAPHGRVKFPSRKASWLFAILALNRGFALDREFVAGALWPESNRETTLHNLRQTLTALRQCLGDSGPLIQSPGKRTIALAEDVWVDALDFDLLQRGDSTVELEEAAALYRGPIVPQCEEPLVQEARETFERRFTDLAKRLSHRYEEAGRLQDAIAILYRSKNLDGQPDESTHRELMRIMAKSGERSEALHLYRSLRTTLRSELDMEPTPAVRQLAKEIRASMTGSGLGPTPRNPSRPPWPGSAQPLIGRQNELKRVISLISRVRLVTLQGVGGVGKTRLAIAAAEAAQSQFLDGIIFIDLAQLRNGEHVANLLAGAFGIAEQAGKTVENSICEALWERELLVVLDNCEHLVASVSALVDQILTATNGVRFLATSRQSLNVLGEQVSPVLPFASPLASEKSAALLQNDAIRMFLQRAKLGTPPKAQLLCIAEICRQVDALPLGLELASSSTRLFNIFEIRDRLKSRNGLLVSNPRLPSRHRTMDSAIGWSWDLLNGREKAVLSCVAVFRGGATLKAICQVSGRPEEDLTLQLLSQLSERSLIVAVAKPHENRFTMLETIQQAVERRVKSDGAWTALQRAHSDYFLQFAQGAALGASEPEEAEWFRILEVEHDNLRIALDRVCASKQGEQAVRFCVALGRFWDTHGHLREGRSRSEAVLTQFGSIAPQEEISNLRVHAAWMALAQRDPDRAKHHFELALHFFMSTGNQRRVGHIHNGLGGAYLLSEDFEQARFHSLSALQTARDLGIKRGEATVLSNLGELATMTKSYVEAREYLQQGLNLGSEAKETRGQLFCNLSMLEFQEGNYLASRGCAAEAFKTFREAGVSVEYPIALASIGIAETLLGEYSRAAFILGSAEYLAEGHGLLFSVQMESLVKLCREEIGKMIGDYRLNELWSQCRGKTQEQLLQFAAQR